MLEFLNSLPPLGRTCIVSSIAFFCALFLSLVLVPIVRKGLIRVGMMDQPDARRVNKMPTPRGGGIAIYFSVIITLMGLQFFNLLPESAYSEQRHVYYISLTAIAILGIIDDKFNLRAIVKLLGQILIALFFCYNGIFFNVPASWHLAPWLLWILTVVWIVGIINAFNLIDGLDGLASGLALIACVGMIGALLTQSAFIYLTPYVVLAGALLGFLRYNFNPASIFLGDCGSMQIGLVLATLPLLSQRGNTTMLLSIGLPMLCAGVPITDTALAIVRRTIRALLRRGKSTTHTDGVMTADKDHLHHRMLKQFSGNQRRAVGMLYLMAILVVGVGFLALLAKDRGVAIFMVAFLAFSFAITRYMTNIELWDTGRLFFKAAQRSYHAFSVPMYILFDILLMWVAFRLALYLTNLSIPLTQRIPIFLCCVVPLFCFLVLYQAHSRIWSQATALDMWHVISSILSGAIITNALLYVIFCHECNDMLRLNITFFVILPFALCGVRLLSNVLTQATSSIENLRLKRRSLTNSAYQRTILYGAGLNMFCYLRFYTINLMHNSQCIIGALDDNPSIHGRYYHDIMILGNLEQFEMVYDRYKPTKIVITTPAISSERSREIYAFAKRHNLILTRFNMRERAIPILQTPEEERVESETP